MFLPYQLVRIDGTVRSARTGGQLPGPASERGATGDEGGEPDGAPVVAGDAEAGAGSDGTVSAAAPNGHDAGVR